MSGSVIYKKTQREQVYDRLYKQITSASYNPDDGLASVRDLAKRFGTSVCTVHHAVKKLESEGHLVRRRASATYESAQHTRITAKDIVGLWIGGRGEHIWSDLNAMISVRLLKGRMLPVSLLTEHEEVARVMEHISKTAARYFIVHGRMITAEALSYLLTKRKTVIGVAEWGCSADHQGCYRVLSDHRMGGRLAAEHLWALGHRSVLMVTQPLDYLPMPETHVGHWFAKSFTSMGGQCEIIQSKSSDADSCMDTQDFVSRFRRADPPTAVFGPRDLEAWAAQREIRQHLGELNGKIAIVGYYDTPWSSMTHPSITTVSLNLSQITEETVRILEAVQQGQEPKDSLVYVQPQLIVRETSRPGPMAAPGLMSVTSS